MAHETRNVPYPKLRELVFEYCKAKDPGRISKSITATLIFLDGLALSMLPDELRERAIAAQKSFRALNGTNPAEIYYNQFESRDLGQILAFRNEYTKFRQYSNSRIQSLVRKKLLEQKGRGANASVSLGTEMPSKR